MTHIMEQTTEMDAKNALWVSAVPEMNLLKARLPLDVDVPWDIKLFAAECCPAQADAKFQGSGLFPIYERWAASKRQGGVQAGRYAVNQFGEELGKIRKRERVKTGSVWRVALTPLGLSFSVPVPVPNNAAVAHTGAAAMQL